MTDVEVHIDLEGQARPLGILYRQVSRRGETVTFEYDAAWLEDANRFSIEPALTLDAALSQLPYRYDDRRQRLRDGLTQAGFAQ